MKAQFLVNFLSMLSWRLSFLAGELPHQPYVEGGHDVYTSKITQTYVIKIQVNSVHMCSKYFHLASPVSLLFAAEASQWVRITSIADDARLPASAETSTPEVREDQSARATCFEFLPTLSAIVCGRGQNFLQQNKIGYRDKDFDTV